MTDHQTITALYVLCDVLLIIICYLWLHGAIVFLSLATTLDRRISRLQLLLWPLMWLTPRFWRGFWRGVDNGTS